MDCFVAFAIAHALRNDEAVKNSAFSYNSQNLGLPRFDKVKSRNDDSFGLLRRFVELPCNDGKSR
ncbi:hypothetical protein [Helicobacter sp. 23-1045]